MEVDQGSKVITLLLPVIARIALPLTLIIIAIAAVLLAIAWLASLDEVLYKYVVRFFTYKPAPQ